jgi:hypothetical protein
VLEPGIDGFFEFVCHGISIIHWLVALLSPETVPFMPLRVAGYFRQKPFLLFFHATARGGLFSPETVPAQRAPGFRHLPAGRRFALHP